MKTLLTLLAILMAFAMPAKADQLSIMNAIERDANKMTSLSQAGTNALNRGDVKSACRSVKSMDRVFYNLVSNRHRLDDKLYPSHMIRDIDDNINVMNQMLGMLAPLKAHC